MRALLIGARATGTGGGYHGVKILKQMPTASVLFERFETIGQNVVEQIVANYELHLLSSQ
jgi:hypothetical protein